MNDVLSVAVHPAAGGSIYSIRQVRDDSEVLGRVPWAWGTPPEGLTRAHDEAEWLRWYGGGWHSLLPSAGDASTHRGRSHGFHGESALRAWTLQESSTRHAVMAVSLCSMRIEVRRTVRLLGDTIEVVEELRSTDEEPVDIMWCQHAIFGSQLLEGDVVVESSAQQTISHEEAEVLATWGDASHALLSPAAPLGIRPVEGEASLRYIPRVREPWVAIRRLDAPLGVALSWDRSTFPSVWIWTELRGSTEEPWSGATTMMGIEPSTSWPAVGIGRVVERGGSVLRLLPASPLVTTLRLHVFEPTGAVIGVDTHGRARCEPAERNRDE